MGTYIDQIQQDLSANRCAIDLLTELFEYGYGNGLERAHAYVLIIEIKSNHPFYTRYSKEGKAKLSGDLHSKQKELRGRKNHLFDVKSIGEYLTLTYDKSSSHIFITKP